MSRFTKGKGDIRYDSDLSRIEELIQGNSFSREQINHLVGILNSRVDNETEKQKSSINAEEDIPNHEIQNTPVTPPHEKHQDIDRTVIGTFRRNSDVSLGVGASPIDIARAYMASRTSEGGHDNDTLISKCDQAGPSNEFTQKQSFQSTYPKPTLCWPGAIVHDSRGYATPQSQRGRHRLHDFPRTPYSRTTLRKSTTKLQEEDGYPYTSTPFQPSRTPLYDQVKSRGNNIAGYGSVGPIRRIRNKLASEVRPRGSIFPSLSTGSPSTNVTPKDFGGFLPSTETNLEPGETSGLSKQWSGDNVQSPSDRGFSSSHISSSQAVRKILEHLDRNKPTPKEKEAELKLATSWRRSSNEANDIIHKETTNSVHTEDTPHKNTNTASQYLLDGINKSRNLSFLANYQDKGTGEAKDAVNEKATTSTSGSTGFNIFPGELPFFGHVGNSGPSVKASNEGAFIATNNHGPNQTNSHFPRPQLSERQEPMAAAPTTSELSKDNVIKPSLPSISIKKPDFRAGFTFPVSASSGVLSEMPTPSITPPSSATFLSQPTATELPVYSFGANKSTQRLVFSFPSTSSAPANDDSDLKFSFGSDKETSRLSFSSFEKDAICY